MDELGPAEAGAAAFYEAVFKLLDGEVPVWGVLQKGDYPLFHAVMAHPGVRVVEVTAENREGLVKELL